MEHSEKKVAILLNALGASEMGADVVGTSLADMSGERAEKVRELLEKYRENPPSAAEEDAVLNDFESFFRFAVETANLPSSWMSDKIDEEANSGSETKSNANGASAQNYNEEDEETDAAPPVPKKPKLKIFTPTDDPAFDLSRLSPVQIAGALKSENPKTVAIVLNELDKETVGSVIEELPEDLQTEVVLAIKSQPTAPPELVRRILKATVETGALVEEVKQVEPDVNQEIADLLRGMPKAARSRIMDDIKAKDSETADLINTLLYIFEDILTYEDRSIQKLLSELDTATLVIALQEAEPEIVESILGNLSKRARQSLEEELDLAPKKTEDEVEEARKSVAETIGKLDQDGQLTQK